MDNVVILMEALQMFLCRDAVAFCYVGTVLGSVLWALYLAQLWVYCAWLSYGATVPGSVIVTLCLTRL